MSEGTLTLVEIPSEPLATWGELAAVEFTAVKQIRRLSKKQRIKRAHEKIEALRPFAVLASEVLAAKKGEIVKMVAADPEMWLGFGEELTRAGNLAKALLEVLRSAQVRVMVALAHLPEDHGGGGGGGGGGGEAVKKAA